MSVLVPRRVNLSSPIGNGRGGADVRLLLVHWHPHIHAIVAEGVFDKDGCFVPVPDILVDRAIEIWRGKVFDILFEAGLLDLEDIGSTRGASACAARVAVSRRIACQAEAHGRRLVERTRGKGSAPSTCARASGRRTHGGL